MPLCHSDEGGSMNYDQAILFMIAVAVVAGIFLSIFPRHI